MRKHKGFTLIELLVVIAIIGLLSTLAIVALNTARQKSRDAKRVSDIKQIQTALELYYADQGAYPDQDPDIDGYLDLGLGATCLSATTGFGTTCTGTSYMGVVPRDPSMTAAASLCTAASTSECDYAYANQLTADTTTYRIYFYLEGATGGLAAGQHEATLDGID